MKRFLRMICLVLIFATLCSTAAMAAEQPAPRASYYFAASSAYFWHVSGNQYQIWFDVTSKGIMNELGVSRIVVERSTDLVNWTTVCTYTKNYYPQMTTTAGVSRYTNYVTYYPADGYAYSATVTLYARNSSGYGEADTYTSILDLR